jgi:parallel beta-helix repeat protein
MNGKYSSASIEAIKVNYSTDVYIIGNTVMMSSDNGIDVGYNTHSLIRDNYIENAGVPFGSAIHTDSAIGVDITGNFLNGTANDGIRVYRASQISILNNTILDSEHGVMIVTSQEPSSQIRITDNHIINARDYSILVSPNQLNVEIIGNRFEGVSQSGINVLPSNNSTRVEGNIIL